jgi:hypothetical protein
VRKISTLDQQVSFIRYSPTANDTQPLLDFADRVVQIASNLELFVALLLFLPRPVGTDRAVVQVLRAELRHWGHLPRRAVILRTANFLEYCHRPGHRCRLKPAFAN